jgi:hypothetical protein
MIECGVAQRSRWIAGSLMLQNAGAAGSQCVGNLTDGARARFAAAPAAARIAAVVVIVRMVQRLG